MMDWSNEPYVRLYTRETDDDLLLSWQARAVWHELMKKFDRSGLIETRRGVRGLAAMIRMPVEVVESALPELLEDRRLQQVERGYFAPNFLEAQTITKSDKQRQRESRERRRDAARESTSSPHTVTNRDDTSRAAEGGHAESRPVTLCLADPSEADPERDPAPAIPATSRPTTRPSPGQGREVGKLAERTWRRVSDKRLELARDLDIPGALPLPGIAPSSHPRGFRDLLERIREEGELAVRACDLVVENLIAESRATRSVEWLSDKAFSEGAWKWARNYQPGQSRTGPPATKPGHRSHAAEPVRVLRRL
ncbi:MAG: hypothetical protein ACTHU0_10125 [Kofleriaceae bacterium]